MAVWISIYFTQVFILALIESGFESGFKSGLNGLIDGFLGCGALLIDYEQIKHFQSYRTFNSENA